MKKLLSLALVLILALALASCGGQGGSADPAPTPTPTVTPTPTPTPDDKKGGDTEVLPQPDGTDAGPASFEQVQAMWLPLTGYWNAADGVFFCFDQMDASTLVFQQGVWNAGGGRGYGTFIEAQSPVSYELGDTVELLFTWPAVGEDSMDGPLPELQQTVSLDLSGLDRDGKIRVKVGDGEWYQIAYAGATPEEASQGV